MNTGKTTLLKKIWGIKGKTGLFTHTKKPQTYQINKNVFVVDFPGNNSLDYHAKTFSICGAMNNLIILVIPFNGDVNEMVSDEVANVFQVMQGSDCTKVFCISGYIYFCIFVTWYPEVVYVKQFWSQFHQHFACSFCANNLSTKKLLIQTVIREKLQKTFKQLLC